MNTLSRQGSNLGARLHYGAIKAVIVFLVGSLFGAGSVWSYLDYKNKVEELQLEKLRQASSMQTTLLEIQSKILTEVPIYIEARDAYFRLNDPHAPYAIQNQFTISKARLVGLVREYNTLEARLADLEVRQPVWFKIHNLLPPVSPSIKFSDTASDPEVDTLEILNRQDPALTEMRDDLRAIFEAHGQPTDYFDDQ